MFVEHAGVADDFRYRPYLFLEISAFSDIGVLVNTIVCRISFSEWMIGCVHFLIAIFSHR